MPSPLLSSLLARVLLAPRRRVLVALALPPALLTAVIVGLLVYGAPSAPSSRPPAAPGGAGGVDAGGGSSLPAPSGLLVDVTGAVVHPGVYRVAKGERASAAIAAAGGLTPDADPDRLPNLAARLQDGAQIKVPSLTAVRSSTAPSVRAAAVSLNTATAEQLAAVPGFTPDLAAAVIQYRTEYGGFASTRELVDVLLMSEADFQLARRYVTL